MATNTGGPAFPEKVAIINTFGDRDYRFVSGMTLLDHFAALAMESFLTDDGSVRDEARSDPNKCAVWAYAQAEAMITERERRMS